MRVGLLGLLDDYDRFKGQGIQRYMHEMYFRMKRRAKGVSIEKAGYTKEMKVIGGGMSFLLGNMFVDFSGFDIIHNMDQKPLLPLNKGRCLLITTAHDFQPILMPEYNDIAPKERIWQNIINYGMWKSLQSDYLIARSTLTRDDAVRLGYDRRRITIISDGVDERYFRKAAKKQNKVFTLGYVGAFRRRKNVKFAIDAVKKMRDKKIKFEIWGKPEFTYESLVSHAHNDLRIKFMGFAPEDKIVGIYDRFDAFVFPSVYEGFGIPIIEAQARGLPVIVNKKGKIPREVKRYCFEAEDEEDMGQILEDLKQNGYNEKLKKRATAYARSFTWEKEAIETLEAYKKVFKNG